MEDWGRGLRVKVGLGVRIGGFTVKVEEARIDEGLADASHNGKLFNFFAEVAGPFPYDEILKEGGEGGKEAEEFDKEDNDDDDADGDWDNLEVPVSNENEIGAPFVKHVVSSTENLCCRDSASSMACMCPSISTVASCKDLTTASRAGSRSFCWAFLIASSSMACTVDLLNLTNLSSSSSAARLSWSASRSACLLALS